jgi:hypothetical protein
MITTSKQTEVRLDGSESTLGLSAKYFRPVLRAKWVLEPAGFKTLKAARRAAFKTLGLNPKKILDRKIRKAVSHYVTLLTQRETAELPGWYKPLLRGKPLKRAGICRRIVWLSYNWKRSSSGSHIPPPMGVSLAKRPTSDIAIKGFVDHDLRHENEFLKELVYCKNIAISMLRTQQTKGLPKRRVKTKRDFPRKVRSRRGECDLTLMGQTIKNLGQSSLSQIRNKRDMADLIMEFHYSFQDIEKVLRQKLPRRYHRFIHKPAWWVD